MGDTCRPKKICLGLSGGLAGTVLCFLVAIYLVQRQTAQSPNSVYISAVVATNSTTYILAVVLAAITSAIMIALEVKYHIRLYRASIATVVLFCISLLITICVTNKRQKKVHWVFTGLMLVWMVATSCLWTHSAWLARSPVRVPMVVFTALLALAGVGAAVTASLARQGVSLAVTEWFCVVIFMVLLVCSCAGSRPLCGAELELELELDHRCEGD